MYFMARHTSIDCFEKRGKRGYLFVIGDEIPYPRVKRKEVSRIVGDHLQGDVTIEALVRELEKRFDLYYVLPRLTSHWDNAEVHRRWVELLGQNVLRLEDPSGICELIAGTIGVAEGVLDPTRVEEDLEEAGCGQDVARAVGRALGDLPGRRDEGGLARF
jgi:hypothetical protein